jgi:DNA polymerase-4
VPLRYLFVDFNAYFASVEQQFRPELRGRPVAVVPVVAATSCCIAASYEARRFGVRTGTIVHEARRLCPGLRLVEARPKLYVETHHRLVDAIASVRPVSAVLSIDEMACRLIGAEQEPDAVVSAALAMKDAVRRQVGEHLRCSIGAAPNRLLAKVASDMQKPDGLTLIRPEELPGRLEGLRLTDLPGIAGRMERRLRAQGVTTVARFCQLTVAEQARVWGSRVVGEAWYHHVRGEDIPERPTRRRTLGHSHVLPPDWRTDAAARAVLVRLVHKAAARLRDVGYWAGSVSVGVSFRGREGWHERQRTSPCQDTLTLIRLAVGLWERRPAGPPLKVGVVFGDLVPDQAVTPSLFAEDRRLIELARAMDRLNRQFGAHSVYFGGMHGAQSRGGTRIAFNRIPDIDLPDA